MKNVTFTVEDDVLQRARAVAAAQGTSVNELVRQFLRTIAPDDRQGRLNELWTLSDAQPLTADRFLTREEANDR